MGYTNTPWTLKESELEVKKSPYIRNRESDKAVSTARILRVFEESPKGKFTNRDIAKLLFVSESTVSSVTSKLLSLEKIKMVGIGKPRGEFIYQNINGPDTFKVEYNTENITLKMRNLFQDNKDRVYSGKILTQELGYSASVASKIIQVLLLNHIIKLVGTDKDRVAQFQYKTGNKKEIPVHEDKETGYYTIGQYLKNNNLKIKSSLVQEELKSKEIKPRVFFSSRGLVPEYKETDMAKAIEAISKKKKKKTGILSGLFS